MKTVPNILSLSRIMLCIILVFVKPLSGTFYIIYLYCGLSDILDGFIARKTGAASRFGEKLDSIADLIMAVVLLVLLYPVINPGKEIAIWITLIGIVRLMSVIVALKKFKTFAILHTYGNKITGLALFLFPVLLLLIPMTMLMYLICIIASASAIEEFIIQLTSHQLQANRKSIF